MQHFNTLQMKIYNANVKFHPAFLTVYLMSVLSMCIRNFYSDLSIQGNQLSEVEWNIETDTHADR